MQKTADVATNADGSSDVRLDVIDQLLADLRHESCVFFRAQVTEPWRFRKEAKHGGAVAPFYAVLSGNVRITTAAETYDLCGGDFLMLPHGGAHELCGANSGDAAPVSFMALLEQSGAPVWKPGVRYRKTVRLRHGGGGAESVILAGIFYFGDPRKSPLIAALPPVLLLRGGADRSATLANANLNAIREELADERPGANMVVARLVDLLFMQAVRAFLAGEAQGAEGRGANEHGADGHHGNGRATNGKHSRDRNGDAANAEAESANGKHFSAHANGKSVSGHANGRSAGDNGGPSSGDNGGHSSGHSPGHSAGHSAGWLRGIKDPVVGLAISRMHAAPERRWTLQSLAAEVGCSRAVFAQRFSALVGQGAVGYLTAWRMHVAAGLLLDETGNIASVAGRVGYQSEAAFSIAFKRWAGTPPSHYRREMLRSEL
jgi:AraC-like DNA-binding protein